MEVAPVTTQRSIGRVVARVSVLFLIFHFSAAAIAT